MKFRHWYLWGNAFPTNLYDFYWINEISPLILIKWIYGSTFYTNFILNKGNFAADIYYISL